MYYFSDTVCVTPCYKHVLFPLMSPGALFNLILPIFFFFWFVVKEVENRLSLGMRLDRCYANCTLDESHVLCVLYQGFWNDQEFVAVM